MNILEFIQQIKPSLLLEIGAHFGTETQKFRELLPNCEIIAFEPDPRNLKVLKDRGIDKICKIEEVAISNENGKLQFYLSAGDCSHWSGDPLLTGNDWSASSSLKKPKVHLDFHKWIKFEETIEVDSIRLDDYSPIEHRIIDFIWMDVQGAEDLVFQGSTETLKRTKYLYTEYNNQEMYEGQLNLNQIQEILGSNWEIVYVYADDVLLKNKSYAD
jgi:FkbM family methyltransferase